MRLILRAFLVRECDKLVRRHYEYLRELQENVTRKAKRWGKDIAKEIKRPDLLGLGSAIRSIQD